MGDAISDAEMRTRGTVGGPSTPEGRGMSRGYRTSTVVVIGPRGPYVKVTS
jgi:hypothetical protein